jgi:hypothetical protein
MLLTSPKRQWHRDLVAHPATHAWVLNLYRAGELHPELVDDYFPARHAPPDLAADFHRHAKDEHRHVRMYARAVERLGEPIEEMRGDAVFNEVIRACTPAHFRIHDDDPPDVVRLRIAHFCAHAHFLEKRIGRSLVYHLDACEHAGKGGVATVVATVLEDEARHAGYTLAAVHELVDRHTARELLDVHRRGERRANLMFSQIQMRVFLARFRNAVPRRRALAYRVAAFVMEEAADHA